MCTSPIFVLMTIVLSGCRANHVTTGQSLYRIVDTLRVGNQFYFDARPESNLNARSHSSRHAAPSVTFEHLAD
jgi:hypothetical protein